MNYVIYQSTLRFNPIEVNAVKVTKFINKFSSIDPLVEKLNVQ
jgi:hypothetical protein